MILSMYVVELSWVPEPLSQVCLCIGYVVLNSKFNGSLQTEKLCIKSSGVCVCLCVSVRVFLC